jgi:hypothetical protein
MLSRSQIRHACYRAKNNAVTPSNQEAIALIQPLLNEGQNWSNFSTVWDVFIDKNNNIKIVKPETDRMFIEKTLIKLAAYEEMQKSFDSLDDRELNLVSQIEPMFLEGVMTWSNYGSVWGFSLASGTNLVSTFLYNIKPSQIEVTEEMIRGSIKDADGSPFSTPEDNKVVLEAKPMDEFQKAKFEEFLAKRNKYPV